MGALKERGIGLPVVFLTGYASAERELLALDHGAIDFVDKTRGTDVLAHRLQLIIKGQRQRASIGATQAQVEKSWRASPPSRRGARSVARAGRRLDRLRVQGRNPTSIGWREPNLPRHLRHRALCRFHRRRRRARHDKCPLVHEADSSEIRGGRSRLFSDQERPIRRLPLARPLTALPAGGARPLYLPGESIWSAAGPR